MDIKIEDLTQVAINQRFAELIKILIEKKIVKNKSKLSELLHTTQAQVNSISLQTPGKNATAHMVARALHLFPEINPAWLLALEDGPPLRNEATKSLDEVSELNVVDLPYVRSDHRIEFVQSLKTGSQNEMIRILYKSGTSLDGGVVFEVNGDAMEPLYPSGTKILTMPTLPEEWKFLSTGVYAVAYAGNLVIKRIKDNDIVSKGMLVLHSDTGGSLPLSIDDISGIWKAIKIIEAPAR